MRWLVMIALSMTIADGANAQQYTDGDRERDAFVARFKEIVERVASVEVASLFDPEDRTFRDPKVAFRDVVDHLPRGVVVSGEDRDYFLNVFSDRASYIVGSQPGLQVAMPFFPSYAIVFRTTAPSAIVLIASNGVVKNFPGRAKLLSREPERAFERPILLNPIMFNELESKLNTLLRQRR
jgi:hypothetical protein